jgi:hypothetical protein
MINKVSDITVAGNALSVVDDRFLSEVLERQSRFPATNKPHRGIS